jgi:hypothetical protein
VKRKNLTGFKKPVRSGWKIVKKLCSQGNGAGGANVGAGAAIFAFILLDKEFAVYLDDSALGTFCLAGTALNALILIDRSSHKVIPLFKTCIYCCREDIINRESLSTM